KKTMVKVAYAIGVENPIMVSIIIDGNKVENEIDKKIFQPQNIIKKLKLKRPIYKKVAKWGAFGNGFIWDKT
ncbi:MAG: methionine adenosyltransferase domain-containing protein, partial [Minisyncoccales bacterium]